MRESKTESTKLILASLTLVAVIMFGLDLFGLDLALHRLHEIAWVVSFDNVLLSGRDHLT